MPEKPKVVTILTPCYNEAENVQALYERVRGVFEPLDEDYEHLFIDNASTDQTVEILRDIASRDRNVKVIVNTRNFGFGVRSKGRSRRPKKASYIALLSGRRCTSTVPHKSAPRCRSQHAAAHGAGRPPSVLFRTS